MPQTQQEWQAFAAETAKKAQHLAEKVETGARTASEQSEQIARMADDLRTVRQELAESKARAADPMATVGGSDRELVQRFIDTDGRVSCAVTSPTTRRFSAPTLTASSRAAR
jgi:pantothenate synthetase